MGEMSSYERNCRFETRDCKIEWVYLKGDK